jgi:hypothetical protein
MAEYNMLTSNLPANHAAHCRCRRCRPMRWWAARFMAADYAEVGPCWCEREAIRTGLVLSAGQRQAIEDMESSMWLHLLLWEMTGRREDALQAVKLNRSILRGWGAAGREFEAKGGVHLCNRAQEQADREDTPAWMEEER